MKFQKVERDSISLRPSLPRKSLSRTDAARRREFTADLKLAVLEQTARTLGQYSEKKALIYISSGIRKNGVDNRS